MKKLYAIIALACVGFPLFGAENEKNAAQAAVESTNSKQVPVEAMPWSDEVTQKREQELQKYKAQQAEIAQQIALAQQQIDDNQRIKIKFEQEKAQREQEKAESLKAIENNQQAQSINIPASTSTSSGEIQIILKGSKLPRISIMKAK